MIAVPANGMMQDGMGGPGGPRGDGSVEVSVVG